MTEEADPVFTLQHNMVTSGLWDTEGVPVSPIQAGKKMEFSVENGWVTQFSIKKLRDVQQRAKGTSFCNYSKFQMKRFR